ncbi:MAG: N-acetylglucosamine kinase [Pedobacter sp.]|nr:MAG: N-acetylglucosamine kinase [Pedobacter sp.]
MINSHNEILKINTPGINPYFLNAQEITKLLTKNKAFVEIAEAVTEVYFFGAGSSSPDKHEVVSNGLSAFFPNAFISVDHDLIGSAYATCGDEEGITCILGTGSNISYYDGEQVHNGKHGLGYILGDEGSGTYFGKKILLAYLYHQMPEDLATAFHQTYEVNKNEVIENTYQKNLPNFYLANFSRFMLAHKEHPFIQEILYQGFQEFFESNIKDYKMYKTVPVNFVGSIASFYQDVLRKVCEQNQVRVGKIIQKPIESLFEYILKREGALIAE